MFDTAWKAILPHEFACVLVARNKNVNIYTRILASYFMTRIVIYLFLLIPLSQISAQEMSYTNSLLVPYFDHGKWGYSDTLGQMLIQPQYESATFFRSHHRSTQQPSARVSLKGQYGIINEADEAIVPFQYDTLIYANNLLTLPDSFNLFLARKKRKMYLVDDRGNQYLSKMDTLISTFYCSKTVLGRKNGTYRLYTHLGKRFVEQSFIRLFSSEDLNFYPDDGDISLILMTADSVFHVIGQELKQYSAKEVFKTAAPAAYFWDPSHPGTAQGVRKLSPRMQRLKTELQLDSIDRKGVFYDGSRDKVIFQRVVKAGKRLLLDMKHESLLDLEVDDVTAILDYSGYSGIKEKYGFQYLFVAHKNGKTGILTETGEIYLPFMYDSIHTQNYDFDHLVYPKLNGKYGIKLLFSPYEMIPHRYEAVAKGISLDVSRSWSFAVFRVTYKGKTLFVGENGVEYFSVD